MMCVSIVTAIIGLLDELAFQYRSYALRREAREAVDRLAECMNNDHQRCVLC